MRIAVTGASGLIGSALVPSLAADGHELLRLVRREPRSRDERRWDPPRGSLDADALEGTDAFVHLAGENIAAGRWTAAKKARLRASRIEPTRLVARTLAGLDRKPAVLVSSSAIGYYGSRGDAWLREQDPAADDFLGRLSADWEAATTPAAEAGIRVVPLRTGIVLSREGGALARMLPPFRLGLGGVLGSGRQYFSWIALDDLVDAIRHVIAHGELAGPVNAVAPEPVTNAELTQTLARVLRRPALVPVPAFALRLVFGEMAEALLASARVLPERLLSSGFHFRFPDLERALRHELSPPASKPGPGTQPGPAA